MLKPVYSSRFKKDIRLALRRGKNPDKLAEVIRILCAEIPLPDQYHDHPLSGKYAGFRDCHIEPDWILVYKAEKHQLLLVLARTGTHADLF